jgi:hypothetical protein
MTIIAALLDRVANLIPPLRIEGAGILIQKTPETLPETLCGSNLIRD